MSLVFKTPQSTLNTTTGLGQNIGSGCPECPECPEVDLTTGYAEYTENGEYTLTPEGDGFSSVDVTVNVDVTTPYNNGVAAGEAAQKAKLESATFVSNGTYTKEDGYNSVTVNVPSDINNQEKSATPTTSSQEIVADNGYSGLSKVTISGVTSAIDSNITAGNIKEGVTILGVTGTVDPTPDLQAKNVTPTTSQQVIEADSPNYGLSSVTVAGVTSAIDSNISAGNIKKDVAILGVTGTYDPQPTLQDKTVTPTTSQQVISADSGYDGLDEVTVGAVTSAIDQNIVAGNIKSGVTILGVQGTVQEGITPTGNINITDTSSTNVTNYATAQVVDANLVASNIKNGVSILGVSGSYDPQPDLETKTVTYTANDTYTITPTAGKDGISQATVTVNVPTGSANLESKDYFAAWIGRQTITPTSGYDGMSSVSLDVDVSPIGSPGSPITPSELENTDLTAFDQAWYSVEVSSGSINAQTGNYDAVDADGTTTLHIVPYISDGGDPETYSFPENFNLTGKNVTVYFLSENATITENNGEYSIEIDPCEVEAVDYNWNKDTWFSGSNCPDWSSIGWDCSDVTASGLAADLAYAAQRKALYENNTISSFNADANLRWTPAVTLPANATRFFSSTNICYVSGINTSSVQNTTDMFYGCKSLIKVELFNTANVTNMDSMFSQCQYLQSIPAFNTSNVTTVDGTFFYCNALVEVPQLDFSKVTNVRGMFGTATANACKNISTLGGFANLGKAFLSTDAAEKHLLNFQWATTLTKTSIMNVINNLAAPDDANVSDATLKLSATSYALLDAEDIAIATAKNWAVTSA